MATCLLPFLFLLFSTRARYGGVEGFVNQVCESFCMHDYESCQPTHTSKIGVVAIEQSMEKREG